MAITLLRLVMQRLSCQSKIKEPKRGLFISQLCHLGEDLAKQAAATNKKGVVGRTGKNMPNVAKPTNKKPNNL